MKRVLPILAALFCASPAAARPFLTDEVAPLGQWTFEAGLGGSYRVDKFKSPTTEYDTVKLPFHMDIGVYKWIDAGFELTYLSHRIDSGSEELTGSRSALFNPRIKISPSKYFGTMFVYHAAIGSEPDQELAIERGDDYEAKLLLSLPKRFPLLVNAGWVWKGRYHSRMGVSGGDEFRIDPGDIFETSAALEIPMKWNLSVIGEGAYYHVNKRRVNDVTLEGSAGEAADASIGLNWRSHGWDVGTAVSFGLMDERHTSFDLERGSGDVTYRFQAHYRLAPRKPEAYQ